MAKKLDPRILELLHSRTGKAVSTLRSLVSRKRQINPGLTSNAAAHLVAQDFKTSVLQKLDEEDKASLAGIGASVTIVRSSGNNSKVKINQIKTPRKALFSYETTDYFAIEHINEITRAYHAHCYTAVFILFRKVLENLIIRILKTNFPSEPDLYFDATKIRNQDFSVVLANLLLKKSSFDSEGSKAVERLHQLAKPYKKDANDKTHSWFHVVTSPSEVDVGNLVQMIELVKVIEIKSGIRRP